MKKKIFFGVILLELLVIITIVGFEGNKITGYVTRNKFKNFVNSSDSCEKAKNKISIYIEKFKNDTFFNRRFPEEITNYENNEVDFLHPGTMKRYYLNNSRHRISWVATINSDNFRGENYKATKGKNTKRVVAIGDSHTFGTGLNDNETYSSQLEEKLNNGSGVNWQVLNLGKEGYNLIEKLRSLRSKGLKYEPDVVVLQFDPNDIYPKKYREFEKRLTRELELTKLKGKDCWAIQHLKSLRREFKEKFGMKKLIDLMIKKPLTDLKELQEKHDFSVIIMSAWKSGPYNRILKNFCKENGYAFTTINPSIFHGRIYRISKYQRHFNATGHGLIADYLYTTIKK